MKVIGRIAEFVVPSGYHSLACADITKAIQKKPDYALRRKLCRTMQEIAGVEGMSMMRIRQDYGPVVP